MLINDIKKLSETVDSFDDYRWLSDAALKWESVFSTIVEDPKIIMLSQPKTSWQPPVPSDRVIDEWVDKWVRRQADFIAYARRADFGGHDRNTSGQNWHEAEIFFAFEVIEGIINFVDNISSKSYWRLENIWVKEVKLLMAYFEWLVKEKKSLFLHHEKDYDYACNHIRKDLLVNPDMKAPLSKFNDAKSYIQEHYLRQDGKLRFPEKETKVYELINKKAGRLPETTRETDPTTNWFHAETYVKMFYENIIPAVEEKNKEKVLLVLKAFQYSKMNRFIIINCFETVLAIYFLDQDIIKELWTESEQKPRVKSTVESIVYVDSWPSNFKLEEQYKARFWFDSTIIGFNGAMLEVEKGALLKALRIAEHGNPKEEYIQAIGKLYDYTRLIHEETTL